MGFIDRLQHAYNAFMNKDPTREYQHYGSSYSNRPDRPRFSRGNERSIVTAIYNRIALDVAAITIKHCDLDGDGRYLKDRESNLNSCFNLEANIDQTSRAFIQDIVMSMLDEGAVAIVPIDTTFDPATTGSFDVLTMRTGKIVQWYPQHVKVRVYNDRTGEKEEIVLPKNRVGIIENPLYAVINEPNSTMQRLIRKLALLDIVDEKGSSGKLDLIIQLPYVIKSQARRDEAEKRRKDIEMQLSSSTYGIAYTDGTERITQLNRPVENNLLKQIEYLTNVLYSQLSFHQTILDGTADEKTMLNYNNRLIEPIVSAIVDECKRKFLTKTARSQRQTIMFFSDPFKLVPIDQIADIADKFTRNEILSSNELRQIIGRPPSKDPKADELRNSNLNHPETENQTPPVQSVTPGATEAPAMGESEYSKTIGDLDKLDSELNKLEKSLPKGELKHYASPYYDPVKAHEYYMKNRELKGRKSTTTLNDEGKAAAEYVKKQLNTERDVKVEQHRSTTQSKIDAEQASMQSKIKSDKESIATKLESHKTTTANKIESLRDKLNNMSMEEWDKNAESILSEMAELRASNDAMREQLEAEHAANSDKLRDEFNSSRDTLRGDHKTEKTRLKEEYEEKYLSELDNIKSNSKYVKSKKSK